MGGIQGPPGESGSSPHLKSLNWITAAESFLATGVHIHRSQGLGHGDLLGAIVCPIYGGSTHCGGCGLLSPRTALGVGVGGPGPLLGLKVLSVKTDWGGGRCWRAGNRGSLRAAGREVQIRHQLVTEQEVSEGTKNRSEGKPTRPGARSNENMLTGGSACRHRASQPVCLSCGGNQVAWSSSGQEAHHSLCKGLGAASVLSL